MSDQLEYARWEDPNQHAESWRALHVPEHCGGLDAYRDANQAQNINVNQYAVVLPAQTDRFRYESSKDNITIAQLNKDRENGFDAGLWWSAHIVYCF